MNYDLIVLGGGNAGVEAAVTAADSGHSVAILLPPSTNRIGRSQSNELTAALRQTMQAQTDSTVQQLDSIWSQLDQSLADAAAARFGNLASSSVDVFHGTARFETPHQIRIENSRTVDRAIAERFVLDVGTRSQRSIHFEIDGVSTFDLTNMHELHRVPRTLTVVGANVIALGLARFFASLGTEVTIVDGAQSILPFWDREITEIVSSHAQLSGIKFQFGNEIVGSTRNEDGRTKVLLESGTTIASDVVLLTNNRVGATADLNLNAAGLDVDEQERLWCSDRFQTWVEHIYAVGDVVGYPALSNASMEQGKQAADDAFGEPTVTQPTVYSIQASSEIAMVGKTEQQLLADGVPFECGTTRSYSVSDQQHSRGTIRLLKILFHRDSRELLGIHCVGASASEIIKIGQTAMAEFGTIDYFDETFFNYPAAAQCYKLAALHGLSRLHPTNAGVGHGRRRLLTASSQSSDRVLV